MMKRVVLAGGTGSRLSPKTRVAKKHLLPIYAKPMIYFPFETLVNAGIRDILLVMGGKNAGDFRRLLGNRRGFGLKHIVHAATVYGKTKLDGRTFSSAIWRAVLDFLHCLGLCEIWA